MPSGWFQAGFLTAGRFRKRVVKLSCGAKQAPYTVLHNKKDFTASLKLFTWRIMRKNSAAHLYFFVIVIFTIGFYRVRRPFFPILFWRPAHWGAKSTYRDGHSFVRNVVLDFLWNGCTVRSLHWFARGNFLKEKRRKTNGLGYAFRQPSASPWVSAERS